MLDFDVVPRVKFCSGNVFQNVTRMCVCMCGDGFVSVCCLHIGCVLVTRRCYVNVSPALRKIHIRIIHISSSKSSECVCISVCVCVSETIILMCIRVFPKLFCCDMFRTCNHIISTSIRYTSVFLMLSCEDW